MPIRMLRDWTGSDKVNAISVHAERFFVRLIMKADDHGCFYADTRLLKANLFPLLLDNIREADLLRWMAECQKAGLIVLYENDSKKYLQIVDFRQRLDKARSKFPLPSSNDFPEIVNDFRDETETEEETERKPITPPSGDQGAVAPRQNTLECYRKIEKTKKPIYEFLLTKPDFIEPYVDFWNLFAQEHKLAAIKKISDSRKRKFSVRIREEGFDFPGIIRKARTSNFILSGTWFGFDWIIENDKNYLKVLEGSYDNKTGPASQPVVTDKKLSDAVKKIESGEDTLQD